MSHKTYAERIAIALERIALALETPTIATCELPHHADDQADGAR